ncbi:MAG: hypothetical protein ACPG4N_13465, partial [Gammaproteobacteria bacterium]
MTACTTIPTDQPGRWLSMIGMTKAERVLIKSYVSLFNLGAGADVWGVCDGCLHAGDHLSLVDETRLPEVKERLRGLSDRIPRLVVAGDTGSEASHISFIRRPVSTAALRGLLGDLMRQPTSARPRGACVYEEDEAVPMVSHAAPLASPESLIDLIETLPSHAFAELRHGDQTLYLDFKGDRVLSRQESPLTDLLAWRAGEISVRILDEKEGAMTAERLLKRPLMEWLWELGLMHSRASLLPSLRAGSYVALTAFPKFARVHREDWMQALLTRLVRGPQVVGKLLQGQGVGAEKVIGFLNACRLCGWLHATESDRPRINIHDGDQPKVVFTGPMGAGKTTSVRVLGESGGFGVDAATSDVESRQRKPATTVGFDYAEILCDGQGPIRLVGTPGQRRFSFIWNIVTLGA